MSSDAKRSLAVIGVLDAAAVGLFLAASATGSSAFAIAGLVLAINALAYAWAQLVKACASR